MPELRIKLSADDEASQKITTLKSTLTGVADVGSKILAGSLAAAGAGLASITAGLAASVKSAMDAQAVQAQLGAVLQSTGGKAGVTADMVNDLAAELQRLTAFEDDAIISAQSMLLTFTNIGKDVFPQATLAVADMAQAFGMDLQSAAVMLGKALNDPIEGVGALKRIGVSLTAEQEKMIERFVKLGKVSEAQKVILQELATEVGGSAKAFGQTFAGSLQRVRNMIGDVAERIGGAVLPKLETLFNFLMSYASSPEVSAWIDRLVEGVERLATSMLYAIPQVINIMRNMITFFTQHKEIIVGVMAAIAFAVATYIYTTIIPSLIALYTTAAPVIATIAAVGAAAALLYLAWQNNFGGIRDYLTQVWTTVQPVLQQIWTWLQTNIPVALAWLANTWNTVLYPALLAMWNFFKANILPVIQALDMVLRALLIKAFEILGALWQNIILPALKDLFAWLAEKLSPAVKTLAEWVQGSLIPAFRGVVEWLAKAAEWLRKLAARIAELKLPAWLTPGSPTPFEMGLRGINKAMRDMASSALPDLSVGLRIPTGTPLTYSAQQYAPAQSPQIDETKLAMAIRDAFLRSGLVAR